MTDGVTAWTVARIGSAIYDKIDAVLAGNVTFGGTVSAEGFGTHAFSTGGTGANAFSIRNTTAGTGNSARIFVGNDTSATLLQIMALSSTFTGGNNLAIVDSGGAGGLSIRTSHASGVLTLGSGAAVTRITIDASGYSNFSQAAVFTPSTTSPFAVGAGIMLTGREGVLELTAANFIDVDVYGMTPDAGTGGQVCTIVNADTGHTYTLYHESASTATAVQRFNNSGDANISLAPGEAVTYVYSATLSRWVQVRG